jgi:hypothetical protein
MTSAPHRNGKTQTNGHPQTVADNGVVRTFTTGATRSSDAGKNDYEGFFSPLVVREFGNYMTRHRFLPDGSVRDSDNWQKGIPRDQAIKSFLRHGLDLWTIHRGYPATDDKGNTVTLYDTLSALLFNAQVYFHEQIKADQAALTATPFRSPGAAAYDPTNQPDYDPVAAQVATLDIPARIVAAINADAIAPATTPDYEHEQALQIAADSDAPGAYSGGIDLAAGARSLDLKLGADGTAGVMKNLESRRLDLLTLLMLQSPPKIANQIADGISYTRLPTVAARRVAYVAGPMRGYADFNFAAFDAARDGLLSRGYDVISPADIDRAAGDQNSDNQTLFALRDFFALFFIRTAIASPFIALLPGWESSTGAVAEFFIARWLGLTILDARTFAPLNQQDVDTRALLISLRSFLIGQLAK